ncbi:MAG: hypothetical protein RSF40_04985 [Oscillospiraceae bacterium]
MSKDLFTDYGGFVEKFKPKKTTDDCYTPEPVYNAVLNWVRGHCEISGCEVVRPFYPGGDYENYHYPENAVVVDNPPFSIFSKIITYYNLIGVRYFLFAPHLTLFSPKSFCTRIVVGGHIKYENGAIVGTSFASNMFGDLEVLGSPELAKIVADTQRSSKVSLPKYKYPNNLITVSRITSLVNKGVPIAINRQNAMKINALESQKRSKSPSIFGGGYLVGDSTAKEITAKEKEITAKEIAIEWPLMAQEVLAIQQLDDTTGFQI